MSVAAAGPWWRPAAEAAQAPPGEEAGARPFRAVLVLLFVMILAPQGRIPALAAFRVALLTAGVAVATHFAERWSRGASAFDPRGETGLTLALLAWALVTAPFSYWPGGTVAFIADVFVKTLVLFWLVAHAVDTPRRIVRTAWAMTLIALPLAATAVHHFFSGALFRGAQRILGYESGLVENPNDLALMLNLVLPLTVALLLGGGGVAGRVFLAGCVLLDVAAIIVTFSRAGFLTLACTATLGGFKALRRPVRGSVLLALGVILLSVPLVPSGYLARLQTITNIDSDPTGSAQARWSDTLVAARHVLSHPAVGSGAGMNSLALNAERGFLWKEVHNAYLEYAVELGLPGLALFLALLFRCLANARRVACAAGPEGLALIAEGVEVALWGFVVAALFHPVGYQFYFYWLAGLAVALRKVHESLPARGPAAPAALPWWAAAPSPLRAPQ